MPARIEQGRVVELYDVMPELAPGQSALIVEVGADVQVGWAWGPEGCTPAPASESILAQIAALETQQTPRRIREAALTDDGRAWLEALDAQIAALRAQLGA